MSAGPDCRVLAVLLVVLFSSAGRAHSPYVVRHGDGIGAWRVGDAGEVVKSAVAIGGQIEVPAVGARPGFRVRLQPASAKAADEQPWPVGAPVFVIADTHGEFEIVAEFFQRHGVLDSSLNWAFGRGHLVILGDVFDRGLHQTELLWLFYKLEAEAEAVGGAVHLVLGNHEAMVLTGDLRYLHPKYPKEARALCVGSYSDLWSKETLLGQWLRTKPTVLKLGRTLFLHGGISPDLIEGQYTLGDINTTIRAWLNGELSRDDPKVAFLRGPMGPLWFRGFFPNIPKIARATTEQVGAALKWFDADRIAIGHTIVDTVTPLYDGLVVAVQVYPTRDEESGKMNMEGVFIDEQGVWHKARIDGSREPLRNDRGEMIRGEHGLNTRVDAKGKHPVAGFRRGFDMAAERSGKFLGPVGGTERSQTGGSSLTQKD